MSFEQKRKAERLPLDNPIEGTAGGSPVTIVELSAIGCRMQHKDKLVMGSSTTMKFQWRDIPVEFRAKIARVELRPGMVYESGVKFADSLEEAPEVMRMIVARLTEDALPDDIDIPADDFDDIPAIARNASNPRYVECRLDNGVWHRRSVAEVVQPDEGFVTVAGDEGDLDLLCKTYEYADPDTRRLIRISLELQATQKSD